MHSIQQPSEWVRRWSHLASARSQVLDVACGQGRHMQWFKAQGHQVTGVDRSAQALEVAQQWGVVMESDIENGPWPFPAPPESTSFCQQFDVVVVCNYLWRPLIPTLLESIRAGGLLIYETFAVGNETIGKPSRPDFLLRRGELLQVCSGMQITAYEDVRLANPDRFVQRIVAIKPPTSDFHNSQMPISYQL